MHPVEIIETMQKVLTDDTTVTVDVGSHYIWMARKYKVTILDIYYSVTVCKL